jgi:phospholipid:diacylglycerol acyltransferase
LVHYFFAWVTTSKKKGGGGGGRDWVDKHIHAYINIAGAQLGAPKSASSLLSGEMSDTVVLGAAGTLIEQFLGRRVRKNLWTTWGSLWSLLPKGGDAIWNVGADTRPSDRGDDSEALRDDFDEHLIVFTDQNEKFQEQLDSNFGPGNDDFIEHSAIADPAIAEAVKSFSSRTRHTLNQVTQFLRQWGGGWGPNLASARWHSFDHKEKPSQATWHDLSRTPLPFAPNMKVFCLYGVGLDTERAYYYKRNTGENNADGQGATADPPFILDTSIEDPANKVVHGVKYVDGDGSVPLLSLGYLCADGWRRKETGLNPSRAKVVTREYKHKQELVFEDPMRGGPYSSDHVDIMGNLDMMEDFLKVVSDIETETIQDRIVSDIEEIAERISRHPHGGLKRKKRLWIL